MNIVRLFRVSVILHYKNIYRVLGQEKLLKEYLTVGLRVIPCLVTKEVSMTFLNLVTS